MSIFRASGPRRIGARATIAGAALFQHLARDKRSDLQAVGIAFLPAAKEALIDPQRSVADRDAAREFPDRMGDESRRNS